HVDQAREGRVDPAPVVAGDHPYGHADRDRDRGCHERHLERDACAVEDAREDVAAERIDSEDVVAAGPCGGAERVEHLGVLVVWPRRPNELDDERREDREQDQEDDESRRGQRDLVVAQPPPEELERRSRRDPASAVLFELGELICTQLANVDGAAAQLGSLSYRSKGVRHSLETSVTCKKAPGYRFDAAAACPGTFGETTGSARPAPRRATRSPAARHAGSR